MLQLVTTMTTFFAEVNDGATIDTFKQLFKTSLARLLTTATTGN